MNSAQSKKHKRYRLEYLAHDVAKIFAALPGLIWFRPKVMFITPEARKKIYGGALLIANHTGYFDPIFMMFAIWYRRHRFICLKELLETRFGWILRSFLCIPIDRENFSMDSFRVITNHLRNGELVSMFPEGHINDGSGNLRSFKSGMILMAVKSGAPIIPMYIKKREFCWQRLRMIIGEPVDVKKMYDERPSMTTIEGITKLLYQKEEELKKHIEEENTTCP